MIKVTPVPKEKRISSCDNCNRIMPVMFKLEFFDKRKHGYSKYAEVGLCEDCANAVGILVKKSMKESKSFKYEKDEIVEVI